MNLYLVRHGEALTPEIDPKRPLSKIGITNIKKVSTYLKEDEIKVDTIFYSTKKRAKETALILAKKLNPTTLVEKQGLKPNDPIDIILGEIFGATNNLMIVGHLPFLRILTEKLIGNSLCNNLPVIKPGSVLFFSQNRDEWTLTKFVSPDSI
jgi:phosphohistidine phosphatase